jgi:hypothetical protein
MTNGTNFPASSQFVGTYVPNPSEVLNGGQSTYHGSIAVTLLDRAIVEQVLPNTFTLALRTDAATMHPVIHLIGHQRDLFFLEFGVPVPAPDPGYAEMSLLVPFVVLSQNASLSSAKWHSFVVRMYLNDLGALSAGNSYYAYRKEIAAMQESLAPKIINWAVSPQPQGDVFNSTVTRTGGWSSLGNASISGLADVQTLFAMPLVGADVDANGNATRVICSYWEWDYTNAEVAQATSDHKFLQQFCSGMSGWVGQPNGPSGEAIEIRGLRWRLASPPFLPDCQF